MKSQIYLAGAMGCYKENQNIPYEWRNRVEMYLNEHSDNFKVLNPMRYYDYLGKQANTQKEIMRFLLNEVRKSSVVLVNLKDIDKSLGTSDEVLYAYLHRIPVLGFSETTTEKDIHPWKIEQINRCEFGESALEEILDYLISYYG